MERLISWVEIPATDFSRAVKFYSAILATDMEQEEKGNQKKAFLPSGEGVIFSTPGFKPSKDGVIINLNVGNRLDETIEKIKQNGGSILKPRTPIKDGENDYFALFIDSEGNRLGLNGR